MRKAITISNPLGEDFSIMRTTPLNGMLISLGTNYKRRNKEVRLYELGNIYLPKELPLKELPEERMMFTLGMIGEGDFFTMKGVVEEFLDKAGMHEKEEYDPKAGKPFLHPGRQANILYKGTVIGYLGEVHPVVAASYGIGERAYVAVIEIPAILEYATFDRKYEGSYKLFDIYEGKQIKEGFKSMAYSVTFRAKDKTLEEAEITAAMKKILNGLEGLGIELRK